MWAHSKGAQFSSSQILRAESLNFLEESIIYAQPCGVGTDTDQKTADCIWLISKSGRRRDVQRFGQWPAYCEVTMRVKECGLDPGNDVEGYDWDCVLSRWLTTVWRMEKERDFWDGMVMFWARQKEYYWQPDEKKRTDLRALIMYRWEYLMNNVL